MPICQLLLAIKGWILTCTAVSQTMGHDDCGGMLRNRGDGNGGGRHLVELYLYLRVETVGAEELKEMI